MRRDRLLRARRRLIRCLAVAALALPAGRLGGCAPYTIRGKVVAAEFSTMTFVPAGDPRLAQRGVASVEVEVHRDPNRPNARVVARRLSAPDGAVEIPLAEFGAGWMVEQWRIVARRAGYQTCDLTLTLPGDGNRQRLLIMIAPGFSPPEPDDDLMDQFERFR